MSTTFVRLFALIRKELLAILADRQSLRLLIMPVILQLLLFPFAATLEVKNNTIAIFDQDGGPASREIVQRLSRTPSFEQILSVYSGAELEAVIDDQRALLAIVFGPEFSKKAELGQPAPIQAIVDGRRSNSGQIAVTYVNRILATVPFGEKLTTRPSLLLVRHWYNPNLDYFRFILPTLVALTITLSALIVTAMSVAREREQGTLDQLLVSPLTPWMIFVGKATPALIVAAFQGTILLLGSIFGYGVEFRGSIALLYACMVPYVMALVGIGLVISAVSSTQQQAFLGVFFFVMPSILLSGYVTPVQNMPPFLQALTWANPVRHYVFIAKSVYLKAAVVGDLRASLLALLLIAVVTGSLSLALFQRRLS